MLYNALKLALGWGLTMFWGGIAFLSSLTAWGESWWPFIIQTWSRQVAGVLGLRIHIHGDPQPQGTEHGYIYAANHTGAMDVVVCPYAIRTPVKVVGKKELAQIPFFGWGLRAGTVFLNRQRARQAHTSLSNAASNLQSGWSVLIFPEGTRSKDGRLLPLKKGVVHLARQTGLSVIPMGIAGVRESTHNRHWCPQASKVHVVFGKPLAPHAFAELPSSQTAIEQLTAELQRAVHKAEQHKKNLEDRTGLIS